MPRSSLTGTRIRERRLVLGRKQADLAVAAGISPSYLNLIEHNRRRIGGKLLNNLARALDVEPSVLAEGAEAALLEELRGAAEGHAAATQEVARLDEFVGRFPGWAQLLVDTYAKATALERMVEALSDRMTHDPFLSASMHEVLSTVTAIRSAASILAETEDLDPDWRARFHRNVHEDSMRLTESAEALVRYLDQDQSAEVTGSTPQEELDAFLEEQSFHVADLERALPVSPETLVSRAAPLRSGAAKAMTLTYLERYRKDAEHMPLPAFQEAALETGYDPAALSRQFGVSLMATFRRLASLPPENGQSAIGLVLCDGSGTLTFRKPVDGFPLPRYGAACALWPLYQALSRPMTPVRQVVEMGARSPLRFVTYALCEPSQPSGFDGPQVLEAAMLIVPPDLEGLDPSLAQRPPETLIGTSCRICPRAACAARREPSIMADAF